MISNEQAANVLFAEFPNLVSFRKCDICELDRDTVWIARRQAANADKNLHLCEGCLAEGLELGEIDVG